MTPLTLLAYPLFHQAFYNQPDETAALSAVLSKKDDQQVRLQPKKYQSLPCTTFSKCNLMTGKKIPSWFVFKLFHSKQDC